ncbi:MAG: hypothetical protein ACLQUY_16305 [Ktedonobacterales bacterium]
MLNSILSLLTLAPESAVVPIVPIGPGGEASAARRVIICTSVHAGSDPSRADWDGPGEELLRGPEVVGQPERHRRAAAAVAPTPVRLRLAQRRVRAQPVLLKHVQPEQRVPGGVRLGKRVRLAREGIHAVPADAIAALDVDQRWLGRCCPNSGSCLHAQQATVVVAMLDGLGERDASGHAQSGPAAPPSAHRLPVDLTDDRRVRTPAIATPSQRLTSRNGLGLAHRELRERLVARTARVGHHEAAGPVDDQALPALPYRRRVVVARQVFTLLRTKDQNSSISTVER